MPEEQAATLSALQTALQMEIDGKEFYLKASQASRNPLGRQLLQSLAAEEDIHRGVFQNIYKAIKNKQSWPDVKYQADGGQALRTVFATALENMENIGASLAEETDAAMTAMEMENKTLDFYTRRSKEATYPAEKQLYESISWQEIEHHRVVQDYYEFLNDPAQWYVKKEHTSVDG